MYVCVCIYIYRERERESPIYRVLYVESYIVLDLFLQIMNWPVSTDCCRYTTLYQTLSKIHLLVFTRKPELKFHSIRLVRIFEYTLSRHNKGPGFCLFVCLLFLFFVFGQLPYVKLKNQERLSWFCFPSHWVSSKYKKHSS